MQILTLNGGSSSIKFALFNSEALSVPLLRGQLDRIAAPGSQLTFTDARHQQQNSLDLDCADYPAAVEQLLDWLQQQVGFAQISAVGHRLVHGLQHSTPQKISRVLLDDLRQIIPYDPEHLPGEILLIDRLQRRYPVLPQVACFDTAFHQQMPALAKQLPIPRRFAALGLQRYGFHGISYSFLLQALALECHPAALPRRLILAHLGNGASMAAVLAGRCIDTSMGFTPCGGLIMGSRSGDLDPGVIDFIMAQDQLSHEQCLQLLNHQSGLLGVSQHSSDMRDLLAVQHSNEHAAEAIALFCYQAKKWLGAYSAALQGLDTLVFSGGIGEHAASVRAQICSGLQYLGIQLDAAHNARHHSIISTADSEVTVRVMHTDEEQMIAQSVWQLLQPDHLTQPD